MSQHNKIIDLTPKPFEPISQDGNFWNLEFDTISRQIKPISLPSIIEGDNNSNTLLIKTPSVFNEKELKKANCIISYKTSWNKEDGTPNEGQVNLSNSYVDYDGYLIYTWLLDQKQTAQQGNCTFSLEFFYNLTEDPAVNDSRFYLKRETETREGVETSYLKITEDTDIDQILKPYWSFSSLPLTLTINKGNKISSASADNNPSTADQNYNPNSANAQSGIAVAEALSSYYTKSEINNLPAHKFLKSHTIQGDSEPVVELYSVQGKSCISVYDTLGIEFMSYNGIARFVQTKVKCGRTPSEDDDLVNKKYVDGIVSKLSPGGSIVDQTFDGTSSNAQSGVAIYQYYGPILWQINQDIDNIEYRIDNSPFAMITESSPYKEFYQKNEKGDSASYNFADIPYDWIKTRYASFFYNTSTGQYDIENKGMYYRPSNIGQNSASFGTSIAMGKRSFACGSSNFAVKDKAFVCGCDNIVEGKQAFASGYANYVGTDSSAVFGEQCTIIGNCSFAFGLLCDANGTYSTVFGNSNKAKNTNQFIIGKFNNNKNDTVFEVGYGADNNNRKNLFEVGYIWNAAGTSNEAFIRVGNTRLTETQLIELLN